MKITLYTFILLGLLLVLQVSFLDVLFPSFLVPTVIFASLVIWTLSLGFRQALWYILPLLLLSELLTAGEIRLLSVYGILLSYGVSFLSRRMLIENFLLSAIFYTVIIMMSALFYHVAVALIFPSLKYVFMMKAFFFESMITFLIFIFIRKLLIFFQHYLDTLRSDRALMIR